MANSSPVAARTMPGPSSWKQDLRKQALSHHLFRARQIDVTADSGVVTLQGEVASFYEKQLAQEVVRRLQGVERIENQIEVAYA